jgi:diguanylate cyclase (GGDEF)-like protein
MMLSALTNPSSWLLALVVVLVLGTVVLLQRRRIKELGERERRLRGSLEERSQLLEKASKKVRDMANGDPLTGIANHRTFQDNLRMQWRRTARSRLPLTMLMIDVDGLRHYNESKGHQAGDECLRQIAETLRMQLQRPGDLVARFGGDEFAVLLAETDASGGLSVAEKVRQAIETLDMSWGPESGRQRVTVSVGAATLVPGPQEHPSSLVATADRALALAKRNGRNRVEM